MLFFHKKEAPKDYRKTGLETNNSNYGWYTCVHCQKHFRAGDIEIDHILPRSKGGSNDPKNLQCLCRHCNRSKRDDTSQTKEDLKKRKQSYGVAKRAKVLNEMIKRENAKARALLSQFTDEEIKEMLASPEYEEGKADIRREARKRGIQ